MLKLYKNFYVHYEWKLCKENSKTILVLEDVDTEE